MDQKNLNSWTKWTLAFTTMIVGICLLYSTSVLADEGEGKKLERLIVEWEEAGIDPNHTESIDQVREYINAHIVPEIFASLHIDRDEKDLGIIVLSFTEEIPTETKREIEALVEEPAEVSFRVVKYTEKQLMEKQREVDVALFEQKAFQDAGFTVNHTSSDIINNNVEIGISPFNDETAQIIYDYFNDDMIQVVQGYEVQLLTGEAAVGDDAEEAELFETTAFGQEQQGLFTRIWNWFRGLFS